MLTYYYPVRVKDSQGHPLEGITVEMNYPDEGEGSGGDDQLVTDSEGRAWRSWQVNYTPVNVFASAGGEGTGYNYNSVEVGPTSQDSFEPDNYQGWTVLTLTTSSVTPTFNNQTLAAKTCVPTSANTSSAIQCNAFTAATAAAGGSITYTIVKVVEQGTTTSLSGWTIVSSTRKITIPANTPGGKTYEITVRATESTTGLYSDAVITQVLNKRTPTLTVTSGTLSITYPGSGTYQVTGGTYYGALSVASGNSTRASATISGTTVTVSTASATAVGAVTINVTSAATNFDNAKTAGKSVTTSKGTDSGPTFNNSSVSATLAPTNATTSPAVNCGAFTAATAVHGGNLTYAIQSVNGGAVGSWTMTSTTSKVIKVPASTAGGTYTIVVRATEVATTTMNAGTKDATITVTVKKKASPMTITPTSKTIYSITANGTGNPSGYTYNTFTITPSGNIGTVTYSSNATGKATVTSAGVVSYKAAGSATITVTDSGNNYWDSVSKTCAVTCTLDSVSNSNYSPSNYVASATIGTGLTAAGGSATVTATASHKANNLYASGYVDSTKHDVTDTATWSITSQTFTPKPSGSASTITRFSKSSNTLSHSTMAKNIGVDSVTVTAVNSSSSSATKTATATIDNKRTWGNPTVSHTTPVSLAVAGQTYTMSPTISQTATYTSGSSESNTTGTYTYAVTTSKTGYSLSSNQVTVTNNTSTSARNGFVVTITGTGKTGTDSTYDSGYGKTGTKAVTFNQAAGAKVYANPVVNAYTYSTSVSAAGVTDLSPASLTYSQSYTWNGVSGSGGTITTGGTLTFTRATTYSWMTAGTNFATTGKINVASRGTTTGTARDFYDALSVTVTLNGKTSASKTCTAGKQVANAIITTQKYKNTSGTTGYNIVYTNPTCSVVSGSLTAGGGTFYVNCAVVNNTNWYYKYNSGSYTSQQTGTENGTAKWRITSNGNNRFSHPTSGGSTITVSGSSVTVYPSGVSYTGSHSNMTTNATTDTVGVTAYNVGDTTKTSGEITASVTNSLGTQHYKNTSGTTGDNWTYGTPTSVTIGSGCTAAGGSASLTCSCTDTKTYYRQYTSGSYTSLYTENPTSSITWSIYSQTCAGGTNRFSISGSTLSHSSMTSNTTYDKVTVKAANSNDSTKSANSSELSISNTLGTQHYKNTSGTTGDNWTYGTPTTASITIGSGLTAAGGSAALSCSTTDTKTYYRKYTSGTYTSLYTENPASSITWSITAQTFTPTGGSATTISRFSVSGSTLSHTTMAKNTGTDSVTVQAANANSTSLKATKSTTISNTYSDTWNNPSVSAYSYSNIGAAGGTSTPTVTASQSGTRTWTSTSAETLTGTLSYSYSMTTGNGFSINTSTGVITAEARGKYTTTRTSNTATVTVTGSGSKTGTKTATCTQSGNTYTDSWNNPSVTAYSYGNIGAAGGTSSPSVTATQSGTRTWANSAGTDTLSNTTFTYSYSMTSGNGFSINTSTGVITAEARGKYATTRTSNTATVTVTGHSKSGKKTATCTQSANTYTDSWSDPSVTAYTYASITAAGGTSAPSVTATQSGTRTWGNSAGTDTLTNSTFTYSYTMTTGNGFTINTSTGVITVNGRGTTIGNARTSNTATVTVTGHSKSGKKTATLTQPENYVTAVQATSSNSGNLTAPHFSYANIGPGATSASPTLSGGAVYTFSSGSTLFNSSGSPSFGGTASYSRSYTLAESKNGFTAVNATSGVLTATSMGTTVTSARTSGTVTGVLTVTYTHASSYSAGGTVTSSTKSDTATCTQTANALTGLSMSVGTNPIAYNSTTSVTVTATYTSGASKNVSNLSATTYNDTSDPDIVQITKS